VLFCILSIAATLQLAVSSCCWCPAWFPVNIVHVLCRKDIAGPLFYGTGKFLWGSTIILGPCFVLVVIP
jgi:hypothetical protein